MVHGIFMPSSAACFSGCRLTVGGNGVFRSHTAMSAPKSIGMPPLYGMQSDVFCHSGELFPLKTSWNDFFYVHLHRNGVLMLHVGSRCIQFVYTIVFYYGTSTSRNQQLRQPGSTGMRWDVVGHSILQHHFMHRRQLAARSVSIRVAHPVSLLWLRAL